MSHWMQNVWDGRKALFGSCSASCVRQVQTLHCALHWATGTRRRRHFIAFVEWGARRRAGWQLDETRAGGWDGFWRAHAPSSDTVRLVAVSLAFRLLGSG